LELAGQCNLIISKVTASRHAGLYTCESQGEQPASADLTVLGLFGILVVNLFSYILAFKALIRFFKACFNNTGGDFHPAILYHGIAGVR
jgi:hypothetical protein